MERGLKAESGRTASPWKPLVERGEDKEIKREAVLMAAVRLFNQKGYHGTSLAELAKQLHISKPTIYLYWKSKDEILYESVRMGLTMVQSAISEVAKTGGSAVEKLTAAMRSYALIVTMDFGACLIRVGEDPLEPQSKARLRGLKAKIDREFRTLIQQGLDEGSIAPCDPKLAAFALAGSISWIARWYDSRGEYTAVEIADNFVSLLLNGLLAPPKTARKTKRAPSARSKGRL